MIAIRRYVFYLGFLAIIVFIFNSFKSSPIQTSFIPGFISDSEGDIQWAKVPVNFPVKKLAALPTGTPLRLPKVQHDFSNETKSVITKRKERQAAVKAAFQRSWEAYRKHAWMRDEVAPISGTYKNGFGGWAASLVDNLDTLWIMGLKHEFEEAAHAATQIDLSSATTEIINIFETNIRHLGGLLSAYDLSGDKRLLKKAVEFGEMLLKAFDTPNRMPISRWNPRDALKMEQEAPSDMLLAEIGSFSMEFTRLSQVTGDMRWYDAIDRITRLLAGSQEESLLPGMWPIRVNPRDLDFTTSNFFTLSAMSDSTYEYLPKMHALLGGLEPIYASMFSRSAQTAAKNLIWKPMTPDNADILMSGNSYLTGVVKPIFQPQGQHLVCFVGGMFALGGKLLNNANQIRLGKKLTDGCIWAYRALPLGIMPEVYHMVACESLTGECLWNETKWQQEVQDRNAGSFDTDDLIQWLRIPEGFTKIDDTRYVLRPEAIESVFILYRITGDEYLLDAAWDMFNSIIAATRTDIAYASLSDVTYDRATLKAKGVNVKLDSMESFWMAETLKYFYLIFSDPNLIDLDQWVFNTEAHPFKRPLPS